MGIWRYNMDDGIEDIFEGCSAMNSSVGGAQEKDPTLGGCEPVVVLGGHSNDVTAVDFAGRSLLATGSSDKCVRLYKWQVGDKFQEVPHSPFLGHTYAINSIAFSPYGTKLASAGTDGLTYIWDVKSGAKLCSLRPSSDPAALRVCTFSPNSSFLATGGDDDSIAIWDVSTLALLRKVGGHEASVASVSFSPDSAYLASGCSGGELKLWDARYGHSPPLCTRAEAHDLGVSALHFSPAIGKEDNTLFTKQYLLATGGQDTDLHLWTVEVGGSQTTAGASIALHQTFSGHEAPIMAVKFSPNGLLLASASGDKTVRLWDPINMTLVVVLEGHKRYVTSCAFSDDSSLLVSGSGDRNACIWQVEEIMSQCKSNSGKKILQPDKKISFIKTFRENKKLSDWTKDDVCCWLSEQGLAEYSHNFRSQAIDGRELINLSEEALENKLGVDALGHRSKIVRLVRRYQKDHNPKGPQKESGPPTEYLCPITQELIVDPVICADGFTYERLAMEAWFASNKKTSPMTNEILSHVTLTPNRTLRTLIQKYREDNL